MPLHCPFDSIIISHLPECKALNWTTIDSIDDYKKLVDAAVKKAQDKPIAEWELEIWSKSVKVGRERESVSFSPNEEGRLGIPAGISHPKMRRNEGDADDNRDRGEPRDLR